MDIKNVTDPYQRFIALSRRGFYDWMPDEKYVKKVYKLKTGGELDLNNPKTYNEKLNWLKLHDRKPIYTNMVDKYEVKEFVKQKLGTDENIIQTYGCWDSFDEIDFSSLPNEFVLKCTHDSGGLRVCKDKTTFDKEEARRFFGRFMREKPYRLSREWPYKDVPPRIIAEKYIPSIGNIDSLEYKATCFNGKVGFVTICTGIAHSDFELRKNDSFDLELNHMPWYAYYKNAPVTPEIPKEWDEIIRIAEKISEDVPCLRVDMYVVDGKVYFGECTFFTWGGFIEFTPPEWDAKLGEMICLPM